MSAVLAPHFSLTMTRFIRAPRDKVFDAFATAAGLASWMGPRGSRTRNVTADPRVGGAWRAELVHGDGSSHSVGGHYRTLSRPARLVYTWQWEGAGAANPMPGVETVIEIDLAEKDGGTLLTMTHSGFPAQGAADAHQRGWMSTLNRLNDHLDPQGTAGTLTLLGDPRSGYTRTARMAFEEKSVAYTFQVVRPHSPEIDALHPFGRIPALRDGEIEIFETAAIVNYVDECFATGTSLRGGSILERTRCAQWISVVNGYFYDTMVRRFFLAQLFPQGDGGKPDAAVIEGALKEMPAQLAALDKAYGANHFVAGSALCAADLFIAPVLSGLQGFEQSRTLMANYPNVLRGLATLQSRASFAKTKP